jgi:hypothetical protein
MSGICSIHGKQELLTKNFVGKPEKKVTRGKPMRGSENNISVNYINCSERVSTRFTWLWIGSILGSSEQGFRRSVFTEGKDFFQ